jgi:hypothetical protein
VESKLQVHHYQAERFELHGDGLEVTYERTLGASALRHMTIVEDSGEPRRYLSGEIREEDTDIGTMATVVTAFAFDGDTHKLSVLLPGVNLSRSPTAEVTSVAIRTVHKGSIGGPQLIDGALTVYQAVVLTGTASGATHE